MPSKFRVVSPVGELPAKEMRSLASRPDTLKGKTVCEIWNGGFMAETSFPIIREMLRQRYPGVKVVPYTEFPLVSIGSLHPATQKDTLEAVRSALLEKGCDAVITGNGG